MIKDKLIKTFDSILDKTVPMQFTSSFDTPSYGPVPEKVIHYITKELQQNGYNLFNPQRKSSRAIEWDVSEIGTRVVSGIKFRFGVNQERDTIYTSLREGQNVLTQYNIREIGTVKITKGQGGEVEVNNPMTEDKVELEMRDRFDFRDYDL